ncbi:hypothetical protein HDU67_006055 [Dinochytrium kinnereticum]|nr:hypothetical protein HDU67_006055 [Dinochytrium kinnereticum]
MALALRQLSLATPLKTLKGNDSFRKSLVGALVKGRFLTETASFEIVQKLEKEKQKEKERAKQSEDRVNTVWPFHAHRKSVTGRATQANSEQNQKRVANQQYAKELDSQIALKAEIKRKEEEIRTREAENITDYWKPNPKPGRKHFDDLQIPIGGKREQFDPINHSPILKRPGAQRVKPGGHNIEKNEEIIANSLPKIGENHTTEMRRPRKSSDIVPRNNSKGFTYTAAEDESLPSYFRFGRPGAGAPILDPSGKNADAKLTVYRGNKLLEKIRCYDEMPL